MKEYGREFATFIIDSVNPTKWRGYASDSAYNSDRLAEREKFVKAVADGTISIGSLIAQEENMKGQIGPGTKTYKWLSNFGYAFFVPPDSSVKDWGYGRMFLHATGPASLFAIPIGAGITVANGGFQAAKTAALNGDKFLSLALNWARVGTALVGVNAAKTGVAYVAPQLSRIGWTAATVGGLNLANYYQTGQWLSSADSGTAAASAYGVNTLSGAAISGLKSISGGVASQKILKEAGNFDPTKTRVIGPCGCSMDRQ